MSFSQVQTLPPTDIVSISTLSLSTTLGPASDCWGRTKPQPILLSVFLHLKETFLDKSGTSDDVLDSVHYGHLTKAVSGLLEERNSSSSVDEKGSGSAFSGADEVIQEVGKKAFHLGGDAVDEVRVLLELPKFVLLASSFSVDATVSRKSGSTPEVAFTITSKTVYVKDITIPVIIGVNPPEREAKQRVIVNLVFYEDCGNVQGDSVDYQSIVASLVQEMEQTFFLTLEKFVFEIVRSACTKSSSRVMAVTGRAQKPSALSFAEFSGVEITRKNGFFVNSTTISTS